MNITLIILRIIDLIYYIHRNKFNFIFDDNNFYINIIRY